MAADRSSELPALLYKVMSSAKILPSGEYPTLYLPRKACRCPVMAMSICLSSTKDTGLRM